MNPELFKNSFRNVAKPSRFEVSGFGMPNDSLTMVKAASVPAETIGTIELPYQGRKIKQAGDRTYAPYTITVINSADFNLHDFFTEWMASINSPEGNVGVDPALYKREGIFTQLDEQDNALKKFTFVGAYPTEIGAIETNWETTDSYEEFTVTLDYDYHIIS